MSETATQPVALQPFCGDPEGWNGHKLGRPFSRGEFTYATDGKILIRVPRRADVPEREDAPAVERVLEQAAATAFRPVNKPELPTETRTECESCHGRGVEHDCPDCQCTCKECSGTGSVSADAETSLSLGGAAMSLKYARRFLTLPGLMIADPCEGAGPLAFRFDGGDGMTAVLRHRLGVHLDIVL